MAKRNRLTNNSDETDIASLVSGDTIFAIPYFQRPYKWKPERLRQLNSDVLSLVDEQSDFHFLGAVIVHGRRSNPSDPDVFDVIDGQQRITTVFLYLCAVVKVLSAAGVHAEAAALLLKYLVINRDTGALSNYKLHPSKDDRLQLNQVYVDLLSDAKLVESLGGFKLKPLPSSGAGSGTLRNNYRSAVRFFRDELNQGGLERVRAIYRSMLNNMSVVQIDVWDPTNGPKIFDSLNSRQEPMTIGDLIRNEVFSRVAHEQPHFIEHLDTEYWQPFYKKFDQRGKNLFDKYFFPYGLVRRPNLQKSEVYTALRKDWDGTDDPALIIAQLAEYQDAFLDINHGSNLSGHDKPVARAFYRLYETDLPSSTYPFLMQLSKSVIDGIVAADQAIGVLDLVESFLVRRATCGHEPTGLHAVFKRLWADCEGEYTSHRVRREISKHKTVAWPGDAEFRRCVQNRALYGVGITRYLILEYDRSLKGDQPDNVPWVEHVLPQNPDVEWFVHFSREEAESMKNRLANLLPLSSQMNISISNRPYAEKRLRFENDSMFKSARVFAKEIDEWTPAALEARASKLGLWALERWPHDGGSGDL